MVTRRTLPPVTVDGVHTSSGSHTRNLWPVGGRRLATDCNVAERVPIEGAMSELSRRRSRELRRRRWAKWRERFFLVSMGYRAVYALVWGALMLAAAFEWTTSEAGMQRTAQITLGVAVVAVLSVVLGLLVRRAAVAEERRKHAALERRFQERPVPNVRHVSATQRRRR